MSSLKNEIHVQYGPYECWISKKWGYMINPACIQRWGAEEMEAYREFLKLLIEAKKKWDGEHE
jgi:hypothetical protein